MNIFSIHLRWLSVVLPAICLASCNLINPDENAPAYLKVDQFTFDPAPTVNEMGSSASTKITDVWVYIDDQFLGAYELPAKIPVLKTGSRRVILSPGIMLNGIAATRSPYPFYKGSVQQVTLDELGTTHLDPVTSYFDSVNCAFKESFDGIGFSLTTTSQSDTVMYQLAAGDPNNFEGLSGVVYLDSVNSRFEVTTTTSYDLPGSGSAVFLELDYKINQPMVVGLNMIIPNSAEKQAAIVTLNPTETWNKIYIQLGYTVSAYPDASGFRIFFGAIKDDAVQNPEFYLDNIKVVHF